LKGKFVKTLKLTPKALIIGLAVLTLAVMPFPSSRATASAATLVAGTAQNDELDFTLVNQTGYSIKKVFIGPTNNPDWTDDMEVLHGRAFRTDSSLGITFSPKARAAKWDIMVEWADGSGSVQWLGLDLTKIEKLTLLYDAEKNKTSVRID
jgi:hypothetical protein